MQIEAKYQLLCNMQESCDIFRGIIRHLHLMQRLRTQRHGGRREIAKIAVSICDVKDDKFMEARSEVTFVIT